MGAIGTLEEKDVLAIEENIEDLDLQQSIFAQDMMIKHSNTKLRIEIPTKELKKQPRGSYKLLPAKAILSNGTGQNQYLECDCLIACGFWYKLEPLQGDLINIFDHLDKLMPKTGAPVGLVSFQNGIQNDLKNDFEKVGAQITTSLNEEKPLCIGLYNHTNGVGGLSFLMDLKRLLDELNRNPISILFTRQMMMTIAELFPQINKDLHWAHIAHSEAGLIARIILTKTTSFLNKQRLELAKRLITLSYGAVAPIPEKLGKEAINTYSKDDIALRRLNMDYLDKALLLNEEDLRFRADEIFLHEPKIPAETIYQNLKQEQEKLIKKGACIDKYPYECKKNGCSIRVVHNEVVRESQPIYGDHDFTKDTYRLALTNDIKKLRITYKIYNGK